MTVPEKKIKGPREKKRGRKNNTDINKISTLSPEELDKEPTMNREEIEYKMMSISIVQELILL